MIYIFRICRSLNKQGMCKVYIKHYSFVRQCCRPFIWYYMKWSPDSQTCSFRYFFSFFFGFSYSEHSTRKHKSILIQQNISKNSVNLNFTLPALASTHNLYFNSHKDFIINKVHWTQGFYRYELNLTEDTAMFILHSHLFHVNFILNPSGTSETRKKCYRRETYIIVQKSSSI